MARLACVNLPALPLQLLVRRHPQWAAAPCASALSAPSVSTPAARTPATGVAVAVVPDQKVQSRMLWVNGAARARGVRTGMPYAAGLSLAPELRAGVVPAAEVTQELGALTILLQRFSPHVEPSREEPGVFWLDGAGLDRLHPSPRAWVERVHQALREAGYQAAVVAGFTRFGTYAAAKALPGARAFAHADAERAAARRAPLVALGLEPALRDALLQLGVTTVADLLALPATGLLQRFGPAAWRLHRFASGLLASPLEPADERQPICEEIVLEYPEADTARLLFLIKAPFHTLLSALAGRRQSIKALHFRFLLEGEPPLEVAVRPAVPTRDTLLLMDLVRLQLERRRLEGLRLGSGVTGMTGIEMLAEGTASEVEQLSLFVEGTHRDLAAGERALARLRAEFGEAAVVRAELRRGHMPAAHFAWQPLERLRLPAPAMVKAQSLVRRMFQQPLPLTPQPAGDSSAALARALGIAVTHTAGDLFTSPPGPLSAVQRGGACFGQGAARDFRTPPSHPSLLKRAAYYTPPSHPSPIKGEGGFCPGEWMPGPTARRVQGPHVISGGWWAGEQQREYYFAESSRGEWLWVYYDRRRGRWFQQGRVE